MIELAEESVAEVLASIGDIFTSHWKEVEDYQEEVPFNPDFEKYFAIETVGALYVATARDEGELVGYIVFIIDEPLHHKDSSFAISDLVYLKPDYRKTGLAKELLSFAEEGLKEIHVNVIKVLMKSNKPFVNLMKDLNFKETELVFSKYIGKDR